MPAHLTCLRAALGPNHAAITSLEGKLEAVRTALTASVKLMMQELAAEAANGTPVRAAPGMGAAELGTGALAAGVAAADAAGAAARAHEEALQVRARTTRQQLLL